MKFRITSTIDASDLPSYSGFSGADDIAYFLDDLLKVGLKKIFEEHLNDRLLIERDFEEMGASGPSAHKMISKMLKEDILLGEKIASNLKVEIEKH